MASLLVSGLRFSSCHIVPPRTSSMQSVDGEETAFDCAAVIDPYYRPCEQDRNVTLAYRSPVVCLTCAGYLSPFADIDSDTGAWRCPLCQVVNPCFYSSETVNTDGSAVRSTYNELQSKHFDYHEEISGAVLNVDQRFSSFNFRAASTTNSSGSGKRILIVLALDITLCSDEQGVLSLLKESMGRSDMSCMCDICIMVYGRHIHLLRLHGLSAGVACNPLQSDTLLGQTDQSPLFMHLIRRGEYCISADKFSRSFSALSDGLKALSRDSCRGVTAGVNNRSGCTAEAVIALALSMRQSRADIAQVKLVIVTGRSLSLALEQTVGVSDYSRAGRVAHRGGCSVDVFFAGMRPGNFDQLDALAGASGGSLVVASAFSESSLRRSFASLMGRFRDYYSSQLSSDLPCPCHLSMPTLEVRTCGALEVHRITGPVVPVREVLLYNSAIASTSPATSFQANSSSSDNGHSDGTTPLSAAVAELAVDVSHVSHSLLLSADRVLSLSLESSMDGSVYRRLVQHNSEHATICGIAVQQSSLVSTANSSGNSISVHFKRSDKQLSGAASSAAYVQFVARFYVDKRSSFSDRVVKVTRVWTQRLPVTFDMEEHAHGLDAELWGYALGREVVADYHGQVLESFDGACAKECSIEGVYPYRLLRLRALEAVDAVVRAVAARWCLGDGSYTSTQKAKILQITRMMYHLREGMLLDGPSSSPMSAYILRTMFLKAPYAHGLRIMVPALTVIVSTTAAVRGPGCNLEDDGGSIALSGWTLDVVAAPPDTTSLYPGTCALLDAGDMMIVRRSPPSIGEKDPISSPQDIDSLMLRLEQLVGRMAEGRYPVPIVLLLPSPGTPQDRFLYARLSPSHLDTSEQIAGDSQLLIPSLRRTIHWTDGELSELRRRAPVTDQPSFNRYLLLTLPADRTSKLFAQCPSKASSVKRAPVSSKMERDVAPTVPRMTCLEQLESNSAVTPGGTTTAQTVPPAAGDPWSDAPRTALLGFILGTDQVPLPESFPAHSSMETPLLPNSSPSDLV